MGETVKDVTATLRRLDEEITGHRQRIAMSQVEICRLEDTRRVLMSIAETDMAMKEAAERGEESRRRLNGAHAAPVLIVRKTGSGDEPQSTPKSEPKKRNSTVATVTQRRADAVLSVLKKPMLSNEVIKALGEQRHPQRVYSALHILKKAGTIVHDDDGYYSVPGAA